MTDIVYATTNPGKFAEVQKIFAGQGITIHSAADYKVDIDVDETGTTLEENAILKAEAYRDAIKDDAIILGDDTGLEIDALGGEPGIKVRRWKGHKMSDEEIIDYTMERMAAIPVGKRNAQFRTVIAVAGRGISTKLFDGILRGEILEAPMDFRIEGLPFQPLFFATEYDMMLGDMTALSIDQKNERKIRTHRERAVLSALPYLANLTI